MGEGPRTAPRIRRRVGRAGRSARGMNLGLATPVSSGWRRRPGRRAPETRSWLSRSGSYRCAAWLLLARAASDPVETFGVDSVGWRADLDKRRFDGVEHRVRAAGEELESLIAHREMTGENVRVQVSRF